MSAVRFERSNRHEWWVPGAQTGGSCDCHDQSAGIQKVLIEYTDNDGPDCLEVDPRALPALVAAINAYLSRSGATVNEGEKEEA